MSSSTATVSAIERSRIQAPITGDVYLGSARQVVPTLGAACFAAGPGNVVVRAGSKGAQVVLIAGCPLHETVVSHGPFVMNNRAQIAEAIERYHAGEMGVLGPDKIA